MNISGWIRSTQTAEHLSVDCRDISHSPDGKFFYTTDGYGLALAVNGATGAISELSASPYYLGGDGQIVVDLTGRFLYMGDEDNSGQIVGYLRDMTTGSLTPIGGARLRAVPRLPTVAPELLQ